MRAAWSLIRYLILLGLMAVPAHPYSVLTHEAIIDSAWDNSIKPVLLKRFPRATPDQLLEAHAYAYGGSIIQDMGYYPFGSKLFTDLLHYVRSGDFILNLIKESQDLNEYAFALGALAHFAADNNGHPIATNQAVPLLYPKLHREFGNRVTYANDHLSHIKTEFAFDVLQVAKGHYAPDSYHRFIGFEVAKPLLERAFLDTYGLKLGDLFPIVSLAIGSYRHSVSSTIPEMTKIAWEMKKKEIMADSPGITKKRFLYNLSRASYRKSWGPEYQQPGLWARFLAWLFQLFRFGSFRALHFVTPTPEVEKLFMASFNSTLEQYRALLSDLSAGHLRLPNDNFDVGRVTRAGEYELADRAYAQLLDKLKDHYADAPPELRQNIIAYYADLSAPIATKQDAAEWAKVVRELDELKAVPAAKQK